MKVRRKVVVNESFEALLKRFDEQGYPLLKGSRHGAEKECLRVDPKGWLAQTPHPTSLGSPLTHPNISTDFCEAQLELITPVFSSEESVIEYLNKLHRFIYQHIGSELLWPFSTPGILPKDSLIPLAEFGSSNLGVEKHVYRKGLSVRYGKKIQTLSGVHYNFSFSNELMDFLFTGGEKKTFVSDVYLSVVRNFLREGWFYTYLFGATPAADSSFFQKPTSPLRALDSHTLFGPAATSLRMSHLGYYSKTQLQQLISFNSLDQYMADLTHAVSTPYPPYTKKGLFRKGEQIQLNDHFLQIEAEHYSRIRPKPHLIRGERPLAGLARDGIHYLEVRSLDNNPYSCLGVEVEQFYFLHIFLVYCLFEKSPPLSEKETHVLTENQNKTALFGRNPKLKLQREGRFVSLKSWSLEILDKMSHVAKLLDRAFETKKYTHTIEQQKKKLGSPELLLSQRIMDDLAKEKVSLQQLGCELGKKCRETFLKGKGNKAFEEKMEATAVRSIQEQKDLEILDDYTLQGYETLETSTQALIREAKKRGIHVEILDWGENLLRLTKGKRTEIVKQASMTSKDSLISYTLMENKQVTKQLLAEQGLPVPAGAIYYNIEEYEPFSNKMIVVKPNLANYGVGISFVSPHEKKEVRKAMENAFQHGNQVIVEEFCEGEEFRFLVVDGKVVAVCQRVPANIVGDGKNTILQLIKVKNQNPKAYRRYSPIQLGSVEKEMLKEKGLTSSSVLAKGEQIFLRKNSNVSTGGESIDFTDVGHLGFRKMACRAAKVVNASICGVDIIIKDIHKAPSSENGVILELNFNPALYLHRYPVKGEKRYVEGDILNFLGFRYPNG